MKISVTRQLHIPSTGLLQTIETIGVGISPEHAFEDARARLDAIEKRFYLVEQYRSNLQLIKRHDSGELLNETELETTKKQISDFEAAEIEFIKKQSEAGLQISEIAISDLLPLVRGFLAKNGAKTTPKKAAKKTAPKKAAAKKAGRRN